MTPITPLPINPTVLDQVPINWATIVLVLTAMASGLIIAAVIWIYREMGSLRQKITDIETTSAAKYVTLDVMTRFETRLEVSFQRLADRVDHALELVLVGLSKRDDTKTK